MLAADWIVAALVVLTFAGLGIVYVGRAIERDADAVADSSIAHVRRRRGGRFIMVGAMMTLSCWMATVVVALLIVMPT